MSTTLSPTSTLGMPPSRAQTHAPGATAPARSPAAPDRVAAAQTPSAPLLSIGAVALAQLVPGVMELEGAAAIASTVAIGVRAAMSNPALSVALGLAASEGLGYAKTLAHDALSGQPASKAFANIATDLDSSVRMGLGIPPSSDR